MQKWFAAVLAMLLIGLNAYAIDEGEADQMPEGFIYVDEVVEGVLLDIRYAGENNFVGEPIDGYMDEKAILTCEAAEQLALVSQDLRPMGYRLLIFDAYRPQRAVDHFVRWAQDLEDTRMQVQFYPKLDKQELFKKGYIAKRSGHSRGSTVDLTLVHEDGTPLDMGCDFDCFDPIASHHAQGLAPQQQENRARLRKAMEIHGFRAYEAEWWHYTLINEPYPAVSFNFPVK